MQRCKYVPNRCNTVAGAPTISYYPCNTGGPSFTVDSNNNVVLKYPETTYSYYTRSTEITLVCDSSGPVTISPINQYVPPDTSSTSVFQGTLRGKSGCPVPLLSERDWRDRDKMIF
ncbi:uncharacterized protein LOC110235331 [Exaiptasia diaphana]|uniref:Uncharacterized protein n=1 Tax=Exaiptasia diaphana TaxID=2652724 RepID=A0A913YFE0_EXADI|nr:uncharacterized protein LOC110235331 [Exaiptasia diaphana]